MSTPGRSKWRRPCRDATRRRFSFENLHYLQTGYFAESKAALRPRLTGRDRAVLERLLDRQTPWRLAQNLPLLFSWCQERMCQGLEHPKIEENLG